MRKLRSKKETIYEERDEEERKQFDEELAAIPLENLIVYVDESGVQTQMKRTRGRAKRGVKIPLEVAGKRTKKVNVVAAYVGGNVIGTTTYAWNNDAEWFCLWFEFTLIPLLSIMSVLSRPIFFILEWHPNFWFSSFRF